MPQSAPADRQTNQDQDQVERSLTLAFLKCDELHQATRQEHGEYEDVLHHLFEPILQQRTRASRLPSSRLSLRTLVFDARKHQYPSEHQLRTSIDAVIVSGSFQDGASHDTRWILRLAGFLIALHDDYPRIRIIGICFGLQIIARAFGPCKIVPNPRGHEIGSTRLQLTQRGKQVLFPPHWNGSREELWVQQVHGDIVQAPIPEGFELLASSDMTPIQAIARFYPEAEEVPGFLHATMAEETEEGPREPWSRIHIIGIQGHPEWHEGVILPLVDAYEKEQTLTSQQAEEARRRTRLKHDGRVVGKALLAVLGFV
ncbi:hypothetical protein ACQY0O_008442 [Thecaphora frezii]